jgi:hypothetical protein
MPRANAAIPKTRRTPHYAPVINGSLRLDLGLWPSRKTAEAVAEACAESTAEEHGDFHVVGTPRRVWVAY